MLIENKSDCKWQRIVLRLTVYFHYKVNESNYGQELFHLVQSIFQRRHIHEHVYSKRSLMNLVERCFISDNMFLGQKQMNMLVEHVS